MNIPEVKYEAISHGLQLELCTAGRLHCKKIELQENCTARRLHCKKIALQEDCTARRLQCKKIALQEDCTARRLHCKKITLHSALYFCVVAFCDLYLHSNVLQCNAMYCTEFHVTAQCYAVLNCPASQSTELYFTLGLYCLGMPGCPDARSEYGAALVPCVDQIFLEVKQTMYLVKMGDMPSPAQLKIMFPFYPNSEEEKKIYIYEITNFLMFAAKLECFIVHFPM